MLDLINIDPECVSNLSIADVASIDLARVSSSVPHEQDSISKLLLGIFRKLG